MYGDNGFARAQLAYDNMMPPDDIYCHCGGCDNFHLNKRFKKKPSKNAYGLCSRHKIIVKVRDGCEDNGY